MEEGMKTSSLILGTREEIIDYFEFHIDKTGCDGKFPTMINQLSVMKNGFGILYYRTWQDPEAPSGVNFSMHNLPIIKTGICIYKKGNLRT